MKVTEKSCKTCRMFLLPSHLGDDDRNNPYFNGDCRNHSSSHSGEWPSVAQDDWCGDWAEKDGDYYEKEDTNGN